MITQGLTYSFVKELFEAIHDFNNDTFKIALYTDFANLTETTTAYTVTGEVTGSGYVAGGIDLTGVTVSQTSGVAWVDFADAIWTGVTVIARGAMIYNFSKANRAVALLDFGANKGDAAGVFTVVMPAPLATSALIRISRVS
jgi:hypothetical protein